MGLWKFLINGGLIGHRERQLLAGPDPMDDFDDYDDYEEDQP